MKTRLDVLNRAMRRLGIKAEDEALTADQLANVGEVFDSLVDELAEEVTFTWTSASVPDEAFIPLANWLAAEVGPDYGVPGGSTGIAKLRVLSVLRPDDRTLADAVFY